MHPALAQRTLHLLSITLEMLRHFHPWLFNILSVKMSTGIAADIEYKCKHLHFKNINYHNYQSSWEMTWAILHLSKLTASAEKRKVRVILEESYLSVVLFEVRYGDLNKGKGNRNGNNKINWSDVKRERIGRIWWQIVWNVCAQQWPYFWMGRTWYRELI